LKNWKKKSIALVASAALMVPTTSAFAEAPQNAAKNQDVVKVASNKDQIKKNGLVRIRLSSNIQVLIRMYITKLAQK